MADVVKLPGRIDLGRPKKPFGFFPSQIINEPKPPQWIVDGIVMRGTLAVIAGAKAVGKSLLMQQMFTAAGLGLPVLGRHTEATRSFAYFCEDAQPRLEARQFDICLSLGVTIPELKDFFSWEERATEECLLVKYSRYGHQPEFTADWFRLWDYVKSEGVQLVGLDTSRCIFGGNENDPAQVTPFVRALQAKAIEIDGAIILNAHPAKGGKGPAGSGAWHNSARAGWDFARPPEYDEFTNTPPHDRVIYDIGSNYTGRSRVLFRWENGVFLETEDVSPPSKATTDRDRALIDEEMQRGLLRSYAKGDLVSADVLKRDSAPHRYWGTFGKASLRDLYASQERLEAKRIWRRVKVRGRLVLRPSAMPPFPDEQG